MPASRVQAHLAARGQPQLGAEPQPGTEPQPGNLDRLFAPAAAVADAVCYEGHVLYPYRASATKNQFRWQWGVLVPRKAASVAHERTAVRTELIVEVPAGGRIFVRVRGLHVQARSVLALVDGTQVPVASFDDGATVWTTFDEAVAWAWDLAPLCADPGVPGTAHATHVLAAAEMVEPVAPRAGEARAVVVRARARVEVRAEVDLTPIEAPGQAPGQAPGPAPGRSGLVKVGITVANETDWSAPEATREELLRHSTVSTHVLVALEDGRVISSLDPPQPARAAVASCRCDGLFPVLVDEHDRLALASPIILYDHPAVAPESPGDMYDATEIDEILALRVRTLTDDEKREARGTDVRAGAVVDRCDAMDAAALGRLHGTFRPIDTLAPEPVPEEPAPPARPGTPPSASGLPPFWEEDAAYDPWHDTVRVGGNDLGAGARVRLHPRRHADAQDLFLEGRTARVAGVFSDHDGEVYLAVALDAPDDTAPDDTPLHDTPLHDTALEGTALGATEPDSPRGALRAWHGRYLYFAPDEVEPLDPPTGAPRAHAPASEEAAGVEAGARAGAGAPKVLVAGVGNVFLGDDGFGVEVVHRLDPRNVPEGVKVADFGIRGVHLAYELLEGYDVLVLVDAVSRGAAPGTLSLLEPATPEGTGGATLAAMDAHGMDPGAVLAMASDMGAPIGRTLVLGCEVKTCDDGIGLSDPVAAALPAAIDALYELLTELARAPKHVPAPLLPHVEASRKVSS